MIMKLSGKQQEEIQKNGSKNGCGNSTRTPKERERERKRDVMLSELPIPMSVSGSTARKAPKWVT